MQIDLINLLYEKASLTALLGRHSVHNTPLINWVARPDKEQALPAITLSTISTVPEYDQQGRQGLEPSRVQFDVWSDNYLDGNRVAHALREALSPVGVEFVDMVQGATRFKQFLFEGFRDLNDDDLDGGGDIFHTTSDAIIWHCPAIAPVQG